MNNMRHQLNLIFLALMFFTRIPVPKWVQYTPELLNQSSRYFPMVGWVVGGVGALTFWLADMLWSQPIALLLSMSSTILLTGAFHEDGFADVCDGFGGGWEAEQVLTIMKDSRLGTYGSVGLGLLLSGKFFALGELSSIPLALLVGHSLSRWVAVTLILTDNYVQADAQSKAKPLAQTISYSAWGFATITGLLPLLLYGGWSIWLTLLPLLVAFLGLRRWFQQRLGGYTGDCLGATQQLAELLFYLAVGVLQTWTFI